jgi:ABC-type Fe3+/spermidine/putrescine transport system ATPase subunit
VVVALDCGLSVLARARDRAAAGQRVQVALRQESIHLVRAGTETGPPRPNGFPAIVVFYAFAGQAHHYVVQLADGRELGVVAPGAELPVARGATVHAEWAPEDVILLPGGEA